MNKTVKGDGLFKLPEPKLNAPRVLERVEMIKPENERVMRAADLYNWAPDPDQKTAALCRRSDWQRAYQKLRGASKNAGTSGTTSAEETDVRLEMIRKFKLAFEGQK
jgi:hypothetical protein